MVVNVWWGKEEIYGNGGECWLFGGGGSNVLSVVGKRQDWSRGGGVVLGVVWWS